MMQNNVFWASSRNVYENLKNEYPNSCIHKAFILPSDNLENWINYRNTTDRPKISRAEIYRLRSIEVTLIEKLAPVFQQERGVDKGFFSDLFSLEIRRTVNYANSFVSTINQTLKDGTIGYYDLKNVQVPSTFNEYRSMFNYNDVGQEALCNIWLSETGYQKTLLLNNIPKIEELTRKIRKRRLIKSLSTTWIHRFMKLITRFRTPKIIAVGTYWKTSSLIKLYLKTDYCMQHYNAIPLGIEPMSKLDEKFRDNIRKLAADTDNLILKMSIELIAKWWPTEAVEDISKKIEKAKVVVELKYVETKYWCFENWISNFDSSVLRSVVNSDQKKVSINFEHNYMSSFFLGNSNDIIFQSTDYTNILGTFTGQNILMMGSLFNFKTEVSLKRVTKNKGNYLIVLGAAMPYSPELSGAYGDAGLLNSAESLHETKTLLESIPKHIKRKTTVKAYPRDLMNNFNGYNVTDYLCGQEKTFKAFIDTNIPAKALLKKSELVIINYVSTAHLETLHSNIPTLIYWAPHRFVIDENYEEVLKGLEKVGILHYRIDTLIEKLNEINNDVLSWWLKPSLQIERLNFLKFHCDDGSKIDELFEALALQDASK